MKSLKFFPYALLLIFSASLHGMDDKDLSSYVNVFHINALVKHNEKKLNYSDEWYEETGKGLQALANFFTGSEGRITLKKHYIRNVEEKIANTILSGYKGHRNGKIDAQGLIILPDEEIFSFQDAYSLMTSEPGDVDEKAREQFLHLLIKRTRLLENLERDPEAKRLKKILTKLGLEIFFNQEDVKPENILAKNSAAIGTLNSHMQLLTSTEIQDLKAIIGLKKFQKFENLGKKLTNCMVDASNQMLRGLTDYERSEYLLCMQKMVANPSLMMSPEFQSVMEPLLDKIMPNMDEVRQQPAALMFIYFVTKILALFSKEL